MNPPVIQARDPRQRVLLGGKIVYGEEGAYTVDCAIKDMSAGGARVAVGKRDSLPAQVYLIDIRAGAAYEAEVVWRRSPQFGLRFVKRHDLTEMPRELRYLARLWNALKH
jgi:hypothetical protein